MSPMKVKNSLSNPACAWWTYIPRWARLVFVVDWYAQYVGLGAWRPLHRRAIHASVDAGFRWRCEMDLAEAIARFDHGRAA